MLLLLHPVPECTTVPRYIFFLVLLATVRMLHALVVAVVTRRRGWDYDVGDEIGQLFWLVPS